MKRKYCVRGLLFLLLTVALLLPGRAVHAAGSEVPDAPVLSKATPIGADSVKITWKKVSGAEGYRVYRKKASQSWDKAKRLGEIEGGSEKSYTDDTCKLGTDYVYTVRAYNTNSSTGKKQLSSYDETGLAAATADFTPVLKEAAVESSSSVTVTWNKTSGAESYRVYRKEDGGKWKRVGTSKKTSYTDTGLSCGTTYHYTVRAVADGKLTSYDTKGLSIKAAPGAPTLTALKTRGKTSLEVQWESVEGADGYRVYRKNSAGKWKSLKTLKTISYVDTSVDYKTNYTYTVRAYTKVNGETVWGPYSEEGITGATTSASAAGKSLAVPVLEDAVGTSYNKITVTWQPVDGADGYIVYRKTADTSWKRLKVIGKAETVSYTDKSCDFGTTYIYTVRAYLNYDSTRAKSSYDKTGVKGTPVLAAPELKSTTSSGVNKIVVKWGTVSGANGYRLYRKTEGSKWKRVKTFAGKKTSYTDTVTSNTTYFYTVRAYRTVDGTKVWSSYDKTGISAKNTVTVKYVNGLKLYYNGSGKLITDVESIIGSQSSYYIKVNKNTNVVTVYAKDTDGQYVVPVKAFVCSTGAATPLGTFTTSDKYRWHELMGPCWGQWCLRINGGVLFHSVFYNKYNDNTSLSVSAYNKLGTQCSHGCVRLTAGDAKWIYDNCGSGTRVTIYSGSSSTDPFGKPTAAKLSSSHTWDPTDPNVSSKCKAKGCH